MTYQPGKFHSKRYHTNSGNREGLWPPPQSDNNLGKNINTLHIPLSITRYGVGYISVKEIPLETGLIEEMKTT